MSHTEEGCSRVRIKVEGLSFVSFRQMKVPHLLCADPKSKSRGCVEGVITKIKKIEVTLMGEKTKKSRKT